MDLFTRPPLWVGTTAHLGDPVFWFPEESMEARSHLVPVQPRPLDLAGAVAALTSRIQALEGKVAQQEVAIGWLQTPWWKRWILRMELWWSRRGNQ